MRNGVSEVERAFQIAHSGTVSSVVDIKRALNREGYIADKLEGRTLFKQLNAAIRAGRRRTDPPGVFFDGETATDRA